MKTQIESTVQNEWNLAMVNTIAGECIAATDENDLRLRMRNSRYPNNGLHIHFGFGHNHFWLSEVDYPERILFVDFTEQ